MPAASTDTIAAIATPPGRGGVGIVRISGRNLLPFVDAIVARPLKPRQATLCDFLQPDGTVIDRGLAIHFVAPHSYTGEDVLELQGHGGPIVLQQLLKRCLDLGARIAEPGEFTLRAFLNDKMDLAQAESVADLIDASSEQAARGALRSLQGEFSRRVRALVDGLIDLRMLVEATLDFPEEEIDFLQKADAAGRLGKIRQQLEEVFASATQGRILREGMQIVLIGQPNVGKSSLMNCLAGDEVAIVTSVAGTTRDTIREEIHLEGVPVHIVDTAGLRETSDEVEQIGIQRTWAAIEKSHAALLLLDAQHGVGPQEEAILARLPENLPVLHIHNKIDLAGQSPRIARTEAGADIYLSAKTGLGIELLHDELLRLVGWQPGQESVFLARERHLRALKSARSHLETADAAWAQLELFAEELRLAQEDLNTITGEFSADDLLGEIFSRFCIGK